MRLLADESCDFAIVQALRAAGHDVAAVVELTPGISDREVITIAREEHRVVLTEDKDFGQLVFAALAGSSGVILIRYPTDARGDLPPTVVRLVQTLDMHLQGTFVTLAPGRVRVNRLPDLTAQRASSRETL